MRFSAKSYPVDLALELERVTGLKRPAAVALARRGITTPAEATEFLAADESHDPFEFEQMAGVVETVLASVRAGRQITIYGDFDCDGVCATSILVGAIREMGGNCDWFIPDRIADGYGLNPDAIRLIAGRGTKLVLTVDCGVTAVEEAALARELGMEIVITDHHQFGPVLPDCPILHPVVSGYPFADLCGAAVAFKLASALRREAGTGPEADEADLDLVALATVADVMPLKGENRHLVREGVKVGRRARRIGLAALMAESRIEPSQLVSEDFGFRLGPRINAAGRMYRADAGVELFLADSPERASEIAAELSSINSERRRVEREVESAAKAKLRESGELGDAIVVAGEGWHPGVVGIVASRLVKSEGLPAVVISLDGEMGRGSARSVPGLDLHSAIGDSSDLLETFGGHAAAAGLSIRTDRIDDFREALGEAVRNRIGSGPVEPVMEFDAAAGGDELGLDLAEEFDRLAPFGNGNPQIKLLIPAARISDLREMGEGKHCRFTIVSGSHRAAGVSFGRTGFGVEEDQKVDIVAELSVNHFNGSITPQLRVSEVLAVPEAMPLPSCEPDEWWERFEVAMGSLVSQPGQNTQDLAPDRPAEGRMVESITFVPDPAGHPGVALANLVSSGERLLVLTADATSRWKTLGGAAGLARFLPDLPEDEASMGEPTGTGLVKGLWSGSPEAEVEGLGKPRVTLTDYSMLGTVTGMPDLTFDRLVLLDPPSTSADVERLQTLGSPIDFISGPDEFDFAGRVAEHRFDLTGQLRDLYRNLRDEGAIDGPAISGEPLRKLLSGEGSAPRSPEQAAALLRVLCETELARDEGVGDARSVGVVSSVKADLTVSAVFVHHSGLHKEQDRFLNQLNRQTQKP